MTKVLTNKDIRVYNSRRRNKRMDGYTNFLATALTWKGSFAKETTVHLENALLQLASPLVDIRQTTLLVARFSTQFTVVRMTLPIPDKYYRVQMQQQDGTENVLGEKQNSNKH